MTTYDLYAGVGPVGPPFLIEQLMRRSGKALAKTHVLQTGGLLGSDAAFFDGAVAVQGPVQIIRPKDAPDWARGMVPSAPEEKVDRLAAAISTLFSNGAPVPMLLTWVPPGSVYESVIDVAVQYGVQVHNFYSESVVKLWEGWLGWTR
jgi:hypothetical protein